MSIEEYYKKRKEVQYEEAEELVKCYHERYNKESDERVLHDFFVFF